MTVKTHPGMRCPKEGQPHDYITETPVEVPDTTYYRRLVKEGSLIRVEAESAAKTGGE